MEVFKLLSRCELLVLNIATFVFRYNDLCHESYHTGFARLSRRQLVFYLQ